MPHRLAGDEKSIRDDACAVGAVYDRPQCRNRDIAGAHKAPLQLQFIDLIYALVLKFMKVYFQYWISLN